MKSLLTLLLITGSGILMSFAGETREYTNKKGEKIVAEFVSSDEQTVTLKLEKNGKVYTIEKSVLSDGDVEYIEALVKEAGEKIASEKKLREEKLAKQKAVEKIVEFANDNIGKKVGAGHCLAFITEAIRYAGISKKDLPAGHRVWGRLVDWENEPVLPGDIVEYRSAQVGSGNTGPYHSAIAISKGRNGKFDIAHQYVRAEEIVVKGKEDLSQLKGGKVMVYRYE